MNAFVHEDISGMYVVQSFGAEQETKQNFLKNYYRSIRTPL